MVLFSGNIVLFQALNCLCTCVGVHEQRGEDLTLKKERTRFTKVHFLISTLSYSVTFCLSSITFITLPIGSRRDLLSRHRQPQYLKSIFSLPWAHEQSKNKVMLTFLWKKTKHQIKAVFRTGGMKGPYSWRQQASFKYNGSCLSVFLPVIFFPQSAVCGKCAAIAE